MAAERIWKGEIQKPAEDSPTREQETADNLWFINNEWQKLLEEELKDKCAEWKEKTSEREK